MEKWIQFHASYVTKSSPWDWGNAVSAMKRILFLFLFSWCASGYIRAFYLDGIEYTINMYNEAHVVGVQSKTMSGAVVIPPYVIDPATGRECMVTYISGAFNGCQNITSVTIPETVTTIESNSFRACNALQSVSIPNSVTSIGSYAFRACFALASIKLPENITKIDSYCFENCQALTSVVIPENVTSIGGYAFSGCSALRSVSFPYELEWIGDHAFSACNKLSSITLPSTVTSIGASAFAGCYMLESVTSRITEPFEFGTKAFVGIESASFEFKNCVLRIPVGTRDKYTAANWNTAVFRGGIQEIDGVYDSDVFTAENEDGVEMTFRVLSAAEQTLQLGDGTEAAIDQSTTGALRIPEHVSYKGIEYSVTRIGKYACSNCYQLTSLTIPPTINRVKDGGFMLNSSKLTAIHISDIGAWCQINFDIPATSGSSNPFGGSSHRQLYLNGEIISDIIVPEGVKYIGEHAFSLCRELTSITLPNSLESIGNKAFYYCTGLKSINFSEGLKHIGDYAFGNCSELTNIYLPDGLENIEKNAFSVCRKLTTIRIPGSITRLPKSVFVSCNKLTSVQIPKGVTSIGPNAFSSCNSIQTATLPSTLTQIQESAFSECTSLQSVNIPTGVTYIGSDAFYTCSKLASPIVVPAGISTLNDQVFYGCKSIPSITLPQGLQKIGSSALSNCESLTSITIPDGVINIGGNAFYNCKGLTDVTVPNSVTDLGNAAFQGCTNLASVTLPNNLTTIRGSMFSGCTSLSSIEIPQSVTTIGDYAFEKCSNLRSISIPNGVTSLGGGIFLSCSSLESVSLPEGITTIQSFAFNGCSALSDISIPSSVTTISNNVFEKCTALTAVTLPDNLKTLSSSVFSDCTNLQHVNIPSGITKINSGTFSNCTSLKYMDIPVNITNIGVSAFKGCTALKAVKMNVGTPFTIQDAFNTTDQTAILCVPRNSKAVYEEANYWKNFQHIVEYPEPDVNQDGETDVLDVVDIARYAVGQPAETFIEFLADLNEDKTVNVADAVVLVNEIAGNTEWSVKQEWPSAQGEDGDGELALQKNSDGSLSLHLNGPTAFTAFQFSLTLPEDMDVEKIQINALRKNGHQLLFHKVGEGEYRVAALSLSNRMFNGEDGELLNIRCDREADGDVLLSDILFVTKDARVRRFEDLSLDGITGISDTELVNRVRNGVIYNLNGQRQKSLQRGVNIVDGKKVFIK